MLQCCENTLFDFVIELSSLTVFLHGKSAHTLCGFHGIPQDLATVTMPETRCRDLLCAMLWCDLSNGNPKQKKPQLQTLKERSNLSSENQPSERSCKVGIGAKMALKSAKEKQKNLRLALVSQTRFSVCLCIESWLDCLTHKSVPSSDFSAFDDMQLLHSCCF